MLSFVGSWNCMVYYSVSLGVQLPEFEFWLNHVLVLELGSKILGHVEP